MLNKLSQITHLTFTECSSYVANVLDSGILAVKTVDMWKIRLAQKYNAKSIIGGENRYGTMGLSSSIKNSFKPQSA